MNSVLFHPLDSINKVITGSQDGYVYLSTNTSATTNTTSNELLSIPYNPISCERTPYHSEVIVQEILPISALDYDVYSNNILISSKLGMLYKYVCKTW